jgi:cardiolipin synthase
LRPVRTPVRGDPVKIRLLVDSSEYWTALREDLAGARERIYVQTLSFEDDEVGRGLAHELLASRALDRRMLVDASIDLVLRDRVLYRPRNFFDPELRAHVAGTQRLVDRLCVGGVPVRKTNGMGPLFAGFFSRNHKKLVVLDRAVAYTGGINFCRHNFDWHDVMLRMEGEDVADFLAADFLDTWQGRNRHAIRSFGVNEVHLLDGATNAAAFEPILRLIDSAAREIVIHSPYFTFPFLDRIIGAARRGVRVTLLTPERNNWRLITPYVLWHAQREGFRVHRYPGRMSHVKALLIDDILVVGSCNFDYISYAGHQEIMLVIRESTVIDAFRRTVLEPDLAAAPLWRGSPNPVAGALSNALLRLTGGLGASITRLAPPKRIVAASEHHPVS